jgi:hypothetical protein
LGFCKARNAASGNPVSDLLLTSNEGTLNGSGGPGALNGVSDSAVGSETSAGIGAGQAGNGNTNSNANVRNRVGAACGTPGARRAALAPTAIPALGPASAPT